MTRVITMYHTTGSLKKTKPSRAFSAEAGMNDQSGLAARVCFREFHRELSKNRSAEGKTTLSGTRRLNQWDCG